MKIDFLKAVIEVKKKKKKQWLTEKVKMWLIVLFIPIAIVVYFFVFLAWSSLKTLPIFHAEERDLEAYELIQQQFDLPIPADYVPIYVAAGEKYGVPWTLLAAHHRIETRFSTMKKLVSPAGAEGHMQFMPCTFVGWDHPTCNGLGEGDIADKDKMNPAIIAKYGGYGVDANGDGQADPFQIEDAIYSAANFLSKYGAASGKIEKAVFQYNHSEDYVEDVLYYYALYSKYDQDMQLALLD